MRGTYAQISIENIVHNIKQIRKRAPHSEIIAVVKANAYGHGAVKVSRILRMEGVKLLGTAFVDEAIELRESGDLGDIFVMIPPRIDDIETIVDNEFQVSIQSIELLKSLSEYSLEQNKTTKVHLFIDTGMHREGIPFTEALDFMLKAQRFKGIEIVGIMTHFACSDSDDRFTRSQLDKFNDTLVELRNAKFEFDYIHAANSAAVLKYSESHFTHIRTGFSLYGCMGSEELADDFGIRPALELISEIHLTKRVIKGETVGYSKRYIADKDLNVALLVLGYGDGFKFKNTNNGECIIDSKKYNLIGSVCMDQIMVDLGNDIYPIGTKVTLIGRQNNKQITVYDIAQRTGTITYEITTGLLKRIPRIYS